MSFLIRTLGKTVISTVVSTAVTLAVKKVIDSRSERKAPRPRLTDSRKGSDRKPAQKAKAPAE